MSDTVKCACCGSNVPAERGPIIIGDDGLPLAASIREGLGLPIMDPGSARFRVLLDGAKVDQAVAFDRIGGVVWRFQTMGDGRLVVRDHAVQLEKLSGVVTVEDAGAA